MAKKRSAKSRYASKYSPGGFCTFAQFLVETICEHKSKYDGIDLPFQFWQLPEWEKFFKSQVRAANKLAKQYREDALLRVLREPKNSKTYTLYAKWLIPQFAEENNKLVLQEQKNAQLAEESKGRESNLVVGTSERPEFKKKNRLERLLEDE